MRERQPREVGARPPRRSAVALLLAFSVLTACARADFSAWKPFSPDGAAFTVSVPGTPAKERRLSKFPAGDFETDVFALDLPDGGFITITDTAIPFGSGGNSNAGGILDSSVARIVESASGHIVYTRDVIVSGFAGKEVEVDVPTAAIASGGRLRARTVVAGSHLYELICVLPNRLTANEEMNHFLDSFVLRPAT